MKYPTRVTHPHLEDGVGEYTFEVTKDHLKGSRVADYEECAGACALKALPGIKNAWVMRTRTFLEYEDGTVLKWRNPKKLQTAIERFDSTAGLFPPGTYVLRETAEKDRAGASHQPPVPVPHNRGTSARKYPSYALR